LGDHGVELLHVGVQRRVVVGELVQRRERDDERFVWFSSPSKAGREKAVRGKAAEPYEIREERTVRVGKFDELVESAGAFSVGVAFQSLIAVERDVLGGGGS